MDKDANIDSKLQGLDWAPAIQHPLDRMCLDKIESIPLMPKIIGWVVDQQRVETEALLAGDGILVTKNSCPDADTAFREACFALDLDRSNFRFFVTADPAVNAFTTGSDKPTVVATSGLVNACTMDELKVVLGHELGHYICGHVRCHSLARLLINGASFISLPTWIAAETIRPLLMSWSRYSEISADRAGLLAGKDFEAVCRVLLKLGGFPYLKGMPQKSSQILMDQHIDYTKQTKDFSILRRLCREVKYCFGATHPRIVERFAALDEWRDLGCYDELATATQEERLRIANEVKTDYLRHELNLAVVEAAADYVERNAGTRRKVALPLLRKAFLHEGSLRGSALDALVYAELGISKNADGSLVYDLSLIFLRGESQPIKAKVPVDYSPDWDFAPKAIREKFIVSRQSHLAVLIYKPQS